MISSAAAHSPKEKSDLGSYGWADRNSPPPTVLILEDDELDAAVVQELLEKVCSPRYNVERARVLCDALPMLARRDYDLALVDMNLPDSSGLDTVRRAVQVNPNVPMVIMSGDDDMDTAIGALRIGAQDFLPKSQLDNQTLERTIQYSIRRKEKERQLTSKAYYDSLTGLANRALLYERWKRSLARSQRAGRNVGVLIADIDDFKRVNDCFGHDAGDALLRDFSARLMSGVRQSDIVARLGGDEFVVVLESVGGKSEIDAVRNKLTDHMKSSFSYDGKQIRYAASIGGAMTDPAESEDLMLVLRRADDDMYQFKTGAEAGESREAGRRKGSKAAVVPVSFARNSKPEFDHSGSDEER